LLGHNIKFKLTITVILIIKIILYIKFYDIKLEDIIKYLYYYVVFVEVIVNFILELIKLELDKYASEATIEALESAEFDTAGSQYTSKLYLTAGIILIGAIYFIGSYYFYGYIDKILLKQLFN